MIIIYQVKLKKKKEQEKIKNSLKRNNTHTQIEPTLFFCFNFFSVSNFFFIPLTQNSPKSTPSVTSELIKWYMLRLSIKYQEIGLKQNKNKRGTYLQYFKNLLNSPSHLNLVGNHQRGISFSPFFPNICQLSLPLSNISNSPPSLQKPSTHLLHLWPCLWEFWSSQA